MGPVRTVLPSLALLVLVAAAPALAQEEPELVDNFGDWSAFVGREDGDKVCYAGGVPKKEEGKYSSRGKTFALVTHRPADKSLDVVSIRAGYAYKSGSEVEVTIGGRKFKLFTDGGYAWARDAPTDRALVAAMKAGRAMVVRGTSSRGTLTTDTYSLDGFTAAHDAIDEACGVK